MAVVAVDAVAAVGALSAAGARVGAGAGAAGGRARRTVHRRHHRGARHLLPAARVSTLSSTYEHLKSKSF